MEATLVYVTQKHGLRAVAPMETIGNPPLQAYLEETRGASGVRLVDLDNARRDLPQALARGELIGIVADRDVSGAGVPIELFGYTAQLPAGPAILAVDGGVDAYVSAVRRVGWGRYAPRLVLIPLPREESVRDRVRRFLEAEAGAFELLIADAPEQWMAIFFRIWPDLPAGAGS
jgi:KDO2-lipid IV(A) lauroyltransferase